MDERGRVWDNIECRNAPDKIIKRSCSYQACPTWVTSQFSQVSGIERGYSLLGHDEDTNSNFEC